MRLKRLRTAAIKQLNLVGASKRCCKENMISVYIQKKRLLSGGFWF